MKPYYSIVSIATNPALNEKFNIGLLCIADNEPYFHFSSAKFKIVKNLLSDNGAKLALAALKGIEQEMENIRNESIFKRVNRHSISEGYLTYLSRYNNNLIQFSAPVEIDLELNFNLYQVLFQQFIFSEEQFEPIRKSNLIEFVDLNESEKVIEVMKNRGVKPVL